MASSAPAVEPPVAEGGRLEPDGGPRLILDALTIPIVVLDENRVIVGVNAAWARFNDADDLAGGRHGVGDRYLLPFEPMDSGGSSSAGGAAFSRWLHAVMAGEDKEFTLEYPCHQPGEPRWLLLRLTRLGSDGPARVVITHEDITGRKRAEEELSRSRETLRGILDHIPQRVFWKDRDHVFLGCNQAFAMDRGFEDPAEVVGKTDFDINSSSMAERYRADERNVMAQNTARFSYEEPVTFTGGRAAWLRTSKTPLHDGQGRVIGVLGTYEDITEHKLAKLEIERLNADLERRVAQRTEDLFAATREAERANAAKSEFLSRMSHELRTPLNAILGFGQLLELSHLNAQDDESVGQILRGGRHLLTLVDEVLDLARVDAGELALKPVAVSLGQLAQECVGLVGRLAQVRGITCTMQPDPAFQVSVWADVQRLRQVLLNLLSNAIKYNHEGGTVTLRCEPVPDGRMRLSITDSGPGLSSESLARLFVPFERLGQEYGEVEGAGLGLVVSRRLAEAIGGGLGGTSQVGAGSTFWVELPSAARDSLAPAAGGAPTVPPAPASKTLPAATLLYVEDNPSNLQVVKTVIERLRPHWRFLSARDGVSGLGQAREHLPDLILLDLQIPGMSGDQVLTELRADPGTRLLPVLLLSADATARSRERLLALGADAYLSKPFVIVELLAKLDATLAAAHR